METSPIQWCDGTVNPVVGCGGCELWQPRTVKNPRRSCYAGFLHERAKGTNVGFASRFEEPMRRTGVMAAAARASDLRGRRRWDKPWLDGMPRLWFVSDMGDALSKGIEFDFLRSEIVDVVRSNAGRRHQWLWLTKQPPRMAEFSAWLLERGVRWPPNLWAGTSITEPRYVDRIGELRRVGTEETVRFLSVEPQHHPISLEGRLDGIDLVIVGGESGPTKQGGLKLEQYEETKARPLDLAWARALRSQCRRAKVAFFMKQLGSAPIENGVPVTLKDHHGGEWKEWPSDLRVREMPIRPRPRA